MPMIRRWRVFAVAVVFTVTCFYLATRPSSLQERPIVYAPPQPSRTPNDKRIHWKPLPDRYPVKSYVPLPTGKPAEKIPQIQCPPPKEDAKQKKERLQRKEAVKKSFMHSWQGYKDHGWLRDEVTPLTGKYRDTFGGWAATLVDALDTLWIMGLKEDFKIAVAAADTIDFTTTDADLINVFETTIRYLGGFLAAYDISGAKYPVLLKKAKEVGDLLLSCFDTPNRMPITRWDWETYAKGRPQNAAKRMLVSELGSLSLEFTRLSQLTGEPKYYDAVQRISDEFEKAQNSTMLPGMWPVTVDAYTPSLSQDNFFSLGGMSDSLYEYFPKQFLLLGGALKQPRDLYERFIETAKTHLFFRIYNPDNLALTVSGDVRIYNDEIKLNPRGQHLTCFTGGMVAIASKIFKRDRELALAEELASGCVWAYDSSAHGIAPELFTVIPCPSSSNGTSSSSSSTGNFTPDCKWTDRAWHDAVAEYNTYNTNDETDAQVAARVKTTIAERRLPPGFTAIDDRRYILRPEAIESVFILYRVTGERKWAEAAWRMFEAVERVSRTSVAAAAIEDITADEVVQVDSMESFWLAETLKYFYLCFAEWDEVSLDEWVLNTEAHPLRRPK